MESSITAIKKESIDMIDATAPPKTTDEIQIELGTLNEGISEKKVAVLSPMPADSMNSKIDIQNDSNKPDYRLLKKTLDKTHARTKYKKPYGCYEACFQFNTGWHKLFKTSNHSDLDKFGAGMVLYFRFVKYLLCFFLLFALLSAPSLYFAIKASEDFGVKGLTDYKGWLYFTTLGSIGRGASDCAQAHIGETISFSCEKGNLGTGIQYGRIVDNEQQSCELFSMFSWDEKCNNDNQHSLRDTFAQCQGLSSCQIQVKPDFFDFSKPGCKPWDPAQNPKASFYLRAVCENVEIALPGGKTVNKNTIGYIIASLDAAICVLFILMLIFLKGLEQKTVNKIKGNVDAVDGYSIQVSNLPKKNKEELKRDLWRFFSEVNDNGIKKMSDVVDVQLVEPQPILDLQIQLEVLKKKKNKVFRRFYEKWVKKLQGEDMKVKYKDLIQLVDNEGSPKLLQDFQTIKKLKEDQTKLKAALQHERNKKKASLSRAFVTFLTKKQRDDVYTHFKRSSLTHLLLKFCGCLYSNKINAFHGVSLKIKEAPAPNNIIWAHLNTGKLEKALRRLVSWVITIGFWAISFAFIVFAKSEQQDMSKIVRPTQSCSGYADITPEQVEADNAKGDDAQGLLECYCRASVERQLLNSLCSEWTLQKFLTNALPFLVVASIILTNYGLQYVFRKLSSFERYQSVSTESTSRIIKIFVAQLLNTGIIILIVNAKFTKNPVVSFLNGDYDDLIPEWYLNVGTTLLVTMIINIVNLPIINALFYFFRVCARCVDRGCTCNPEKTKKRTQEEWEELYTGPEFLVDFRYAQILTVVSICFLYSAGLPLLYLSTFLNLFAVYWMDKLFLLKVCRLPRMFDEDLESAVRKALYLCMFLHLIFAIWTYGNPDIFGDQGSYTKAGQLVEKAQDIKFSYFLESFWDRATEGQNIALSIIMCIFVGVLIVMIFFRATMFRMLRACVEKYINRIRHRESYRNQRTYYECIHLEDLLLEKKYLENEIYESIDGGLQNILEKKLEMINQELNKRDPIEENHLKRFIGIFSYFVGHNPLYKKFFNVKKVKSSNLIIT